MELIDDSSRIVIPDACVISNINPTIVGPQSCNRIRVPPSASLAESTAQPSQAISFCLAPNLPHELDLQDSYLKFRFCIKKNGAQYDKARDQVSVLVKAMIVTN